MFSTGNKAKKTIFGAMTCSKCGKTLNNDENITIKINTKELKVILTYQVGLMHSINCVKTAQNKHYQSTNELS